MFKKDKEKIKMNNKHKTSTDNIADNATNTTDSTAKSAEDAAAQSSENTSDTQPAQEEAQQPDPAVQWQTQFEEMKDKYLRLSAEFDNYRKRTLKEKMELTKTAGEDILKGLLPVMDDFERGLKHINQSSDVNAVKEGILLIHNKFNEFLTQKGIKEIEAQNNVFDTDLHEAITKIPMPDMAGKVVDVVEKGYCLNEKVIRYAKVVVGE